MKFNELSVVKERLTKYISTIDESHFAYEFTLKLKRYGSTKIDEVAFCDIGTIANSRPTCEE